MLYADGKYYWYGENKEKTLPDNGIWHWGVRLYSSDDFYNWQDEGIILQPDIENEKSPIHPSSWMDRPHILYNDITKKYVMWLKIMGKDQVQFMVIALSDSIKGPFVVVNRIRPCGLSSGDYDLVKNEDGSANIIFEQVHTSMIVADLTDDYTDVTGNYTRHIEKSAPPYVREAPAHFVRNGEHFIITSGTTDYLPNKTITYSFKNFHSEMEEIGNPHIDDKTNTSFYSQISSVFKLPNKNLYVALADRWVSNIEMLKDVNSDEIFKGIFTTSQNPDVKKNAQEKFDSIRSRINTSLAEYIWLPIEWKDNVPYIKWYDEWRIEDF